MQPNHVLYVVIGLLVVAVVLLSYQLYASASQQDEAVVASANRYLI